MASITPWGKRIVPVLKRDSVRRAVQSGIRTTGRGLLEYREIRSEVGVIETADGSAVVRLGNTQVIAGVKAGLGRPFPDAPNEGVLIVNAEILPHASPYSEIGPPDEFAIELARVVDRGIRHSGYIDMQRLAVDPGSSAYVLWVDIYVVNDDGNLIDAANMASVLALAHTSLPGIRRKETGEPSLDRDNRAVLPTTDRVPIAISIGKIGDKLLVDPDFDEEYSLDGRVSITVANNHVVSAQKTLGYFTQREVERAIDIALDMAPQVLARLRHGSP